MFDITLKGKIVNTYGLNLVGKNDNAEILLSPPTPEEISKLKKGDEVLIKAIFDGSFVKGLESHIISILPQQPAEKCICKEPR